MSFNHPFDVSSIIEWSSIFEFLVQTNCNIDELIGIVVKLCQIMTWGYPEFISKPRLIVFLLNLIDFAVELVETYYLHNVEMESGIS